MALIGSAYVEIRALDTNLKRDIDNAMKKIKDVTLNLKADVNLAPVRSKIAALRAEIKSNPLQFEAIVDDHNILDSLADAHQLYEDNPLHVVSTTDTSQMEAALQSVRERFRLMDSNVHSNANTAAAEAQLTALTRRRSAPVVANANTARAEAQLDAVSRRRTATIAPKIKIDPEIRKALQGLTYTMLGAVPAPAIKSAIASVLGNIEQLSVSMAKMSTIVGSAGASLLTLGANAFSIVGDLSSITSIISVMPAAITGMVVSLVGAKMAWKNFAGAFSEDAKKAQKAMDKLPTEAQAAVKSMKGLWTEITKPAQKAFWVEMGTSLQDTVHKIVPVAKEGFVEVETSLAKMTKAALTSFGTLADNGGMKTLFDNIAKGLDNASRAVTPFFDAMNRLSVTGSKYLPIFGDWLAKSADRFNNFITKADEAGKINVWINTAVANLKDLGSILGSTGDLIKGLVIISDLSGGKGLHDMAQGMKGIADAVNGEPFRSRLVMILEGARAGAEALGDGFGKLMDVLGRSTIALSNFLQQAGKIGGLFFGNIAKIFDGTGFGTGFTDFLYSAETAMRNLGPSFTNLGNILGDFGTIAGTVLENMVPGMNNLMETLAAVVDALKDGVVKVIPVLNEFVQNILVLIAPIAIGVATAIGKVLEVFAALPEALRNVILGFGLFLIVLAKFKKLMADTDKGEMSPFKKRLTDIRDGATDLASKFGASMGRIGDAFATAGVAGGYAKDAIKKSFGEVRDSVKLTGSYIADGFKKSFSQLGDALKPVGSSIKDFSKMMGAAWKEAIMPQEVRTGFKVVGEKLGEVARIYTGYFGAAKDAVGNLGKTIANALPLSLLGPALKALPGELGQAFAHGAKMVAGGVADIAKTIAGPAVGFAMGKLRETIQAQSIYASKHLENIGNGMKSAIGVIQGAPAAVGGALSKLAQSASTAFGAMRDAGAKAFNNGVLAAAIHPMTAPFVQMADAAKSAASTASTHISTMAKTIGTSVSEGTAPARRAISEMATAARQDAAVVGQMFKASASNIGGAFRDAGADLKTVGANLSSTFSAAFSGAHAAASKAASGISSTFSAAAANLKTNFAPAAAAIRETLSGVSGQTAPARAALGELATSTKTAFGSIGKEVGSGLKSAAGGLVDALGGPFGLAIGAVTAGLTMFAQSIADSKAKVESLAGSLEAVSGRMTGAAKKMLATNALDGATDKWDDFWRGMMQNSKSTEETLSILGVSTEEYTNKLADPKGRDSYLKGLEAIHQALENGAPVTDEMAAAIGTTTEALKGINGDSMGHLEEKARNAADELRRAEDKVKGLASATGTSTVQAQILSKNFETLASTTSTAADKFSALKQNLDLLNRSSATNSNQYKVNVSADKAYQQTLDDTKTSLQGVIEKNGGLVTNLYGVGKGFDLTSQAGRDLHTALDGQSDAILKIGTSAMDQALKAGKSTSDAQSIAIQAMAPGVESLRQTMTDIGLKTPQIDAIIRSFGLMPDQIATAIDVTGSEEAQRKIFLTKLAADAFANGNYKGIIGALPEGAFKAVAEAVGKGKEYAEGNYDAVLQALDQTKGGRDAAFAAILSTTNGDYKAAIKAYLDQNSASATGAALESIANKVRIATISVQYSDPGGPAPGTIGGGMVHAQGLNGGLMLPGMSPFAGNLPMARVKHFANGGFENHVAQISKGQTPYRVWSEPESGGEAYVPLAKSKRPRSLKILEEVAEMFGYSLSKRLKFASGGIIKSMPSKSPAVSRSDFAPRTVVAPIQSTHAPTVITNVYPSAGLNETQVADSVSENIYWKLSTKI